VQKFEFGAKARKIQTKNKKQCPHKVQMMLKMIM